MSAYACLIRLAWLAVSAALAVQAPSSHESGHGPDASEQIAAAFGSSLALSDLDRSDSPERMGPEPSSPATVTSLCLLVESAAQAHGLPLEFFARLIWQESRFNPGALGPATRGGQRAQGIAQFMPDTAKERGVFDPFDPVAALPKSAELLHELRTQFGNLGLAAAAYNAGPKRVRDWLAGHGNLPGQTRSYVSAVTGRSADDWAATMRQRNGGPDLSPANSIFCGDLIAQLRAQPALFAGELERRMRESAAMPWGVQLSAGFGRDHVLAAYASIEKSYRDILERRDPIIIESRLRNRGTQPFYQVRVGADTRASADELCSALRKAGGVCMVLRNPEPPPQAL
jgi:Transglycosylase SLT domain/SPOR domain